MKNKVINFIKNEGMIIGFYLIVALLTRLYIVRVIG